MSKHCTDCGGTSRDARETAALAARDADFKHRVKHHRSYVRCWTWNSNGLDPAEFFRFGGQRARAPVRGEAYVFRENQAQQCLETRILTSGFSDKYRVVELPGRSSD